MTDRLDINLGQSLHYEYEARFENITWTSTYLLNEGSSPSESRVCDHLSYEWCR